MKLSTLVGCCFVLMLALPACGDDADDTGPASSSSSSSGSGGNGVGGLGSGVGGEGGMEEQLIHGCTSDMAEDMTTEAQVPVLWSNPHSRCIRVVAGTDVFFSGNFAAHPMKGGISPNIDAAALITLADQSCKQAMVTLTDLGPYPYFCENYAGCYLRG